MVTGMQDKQSFSRKILIVRACMHAGMQWHYEQMGKQQQRSIMRTMPDKLNGNHEQMGKRQQRSIVRTMPDKPNEVRYASACSGPTCIQHAKDAKLLRQSKS